jgi:hypothetical protein
MKGGQYEGKCSRRWEGKRESRWGEYEKYMVCIYENSL